MAQARWNGVDGLDDRTPAPYWRIGIRHDLADAARSYDWLLAFTQSGWSETYDRFSSPLDVQIVDEGRVGTGPAEARRPARDAAPALASIRLANGDTGYVELSPEGQRRLSALGAEAVTGFDNADVVERHRHPRGIKWMSLNRLMRLREEEAAGQRPRRTLGPV